MKKLLFSLSLLLLTIASFGQVHNAVPVCHVSGDPDGITATETQNQLVECAVAKDTTNGTLYVYDGTQPLGSRWIPVPLTTTSDSNTRLDNPRVTGGNLVFDIIDVTNGNAILGTVSVAVTDIAPVQDVVGANDITVTNSGGTYTVDFTETNTSLTYTSGTNTLNYTDENGATTNLALNTADGSETIVNGSGDISITGNGTSATPYVVSFTETNTVLSLSGTTLSYVDENGATTNLDLSAIQDGVITGLSFTGTGDARNFTVTRSVGANITGSIDVADSDSDPANELQTLSHSGNVTTLSDGGGTISVAGSTSAGFQTDVSQSSGVYTVSLPTTIPVFISNAAAVAANGTGSWYRCGFGSTECTAGDVRQAY